MAVRCEEEEKRKESFLAEVSSRYCTRDILTSFVGALLGALEGDRLGLVVGYEMNDEKKEGRIYHESC